MRARVIKIGNSQGLRIPKPILEQTGIMDDVEIEVEKNQIIIRPIKNVREGWDAAFKDSIQPGLPVPNLLAVEPWIDLTTAEIGVELLNEANILLAMGEKHPWSIP